MWSLGGTGRRALWLCFSSWTAQLTVAANAPMLCLSQVSGLSCSLHCFPSARMSTESLCSFWLKGSLATTGWLFFPGWALMQSSGYRDVFVALPSPFPFSFHPFVPTCPLLDVLCRTFSHALHWEGSYLLIYICSNGWNGKVWDQGNVSYCHSSDIT